MTVVYSGHGHLRHRFAGEVLGLVSLRSHGAVSGVQEYRSKSPEERRGLEGGLVRRVWTWARGARLACRVQSPGRAWCYGASRQQQGGPAGRACLRRRTQSAVYESPRGPARAFTSSRCWAVLGVSPLQSCGPVAMGEAMAVGARRVSGADTLTKAAIGTNC